MRTVESPLCSMYTTRPVCSRYTTSLSAESEQAGDGFPVTYLLIIVQYVYDMNRFEHSLVHENGECHRPEHVIAVLSDIFGEGFTLDIDDNAIGRAVKSNHHQRSPVTLLVQKRIEELRESYRGIVGNVANILKVSIVLKEDRIV